MTTRPEPTYGPTLDYDPLLRVVRYTSVAECKRRLGLTTTDTAWDTAIQQAAITGELQIDIHLGGAYTYTAWGPTAADPAVPLFITQAAENVTVAVLKQTDAPFGVAGSDEFMGELTIEDQVRKELRYSPLFMGQAVQFGFSGGTQSDPAEVTP